MVTRAIRDAPRREREFSSTPRTGPYVPPRRRENGLNKMAEILP